jgi:hypothetical protein
MTCPNCDHHFEGDRCPNCGHSVESSGKLVAVLFFAGLVLPTAYMGFCSAQIGREALGRGDTGSALFQALLFGFVSLIGFIGSIVLVVWQWRK